ncbi:MAG: DUF167 domain-containing protein [Candidatus Hydrogenedens sp.]
MKSKTTYKFKVHISPNAHFNSIKVKEDSTLHIYVNAPPEKGKANEKLIDIIADWLKINKKEIHIVQGLTSKIKLLEIPDEFKLQFFHELNELKNKLWRE